jgi:integrase
MGKLTAMAVRNLKEAGRYTDGDGLMLVIGKDGSRKWVLRVQVNGTRRDIGLGATNDVSLSEARERASDTRKIAKAGRDPVEEKRRAAQKPLTFREAAERVHAEHSPTWKNAKHAEQWINSLRSYAFPRFGDIPVNEIEAPLILEVLQKIWLTLPETARRVRQRIGTVLDWAHAAGLRPTEAPIRSVNKGLARQPKRDNHFTAMPWKKIPDFLLALDTSDKTGPTVKALLEFVILTACRSGEARGATWAEIDEEAAEWRVPAERMKAGKIHVVPLSEPALAVLRNVRAQTINDDPSTLIFQGAKPKTPFSDMTLTMALRRMKLDATAHGFRSSFRDWAAEATNIPSEIAELCLAHTVGTAVERAYRRSDLIEKRRTLMDQWAAFVRLSSGNSSAS